MTSLIVRACAALLLPLFARAQTVDTNFRIVLSHSPAGSGAVVAHIATTSTYPCAGYRIQTGVRVSNDTLTVLLGGLVRPGPCLQTFDNATGSAYWGHMQSTRVVIEFVYRERVDRYLVTEVHRSFRIQPLQQDFTEVSFDE